MKFKPDLLIMRILSIAFLILFIGVSCFGQEFEINGSLNTSSEKRFQGAYGIGLQYQHDIGNKFKAGIGIHYNSKNAEFDEIQYVDADPDLLIADRINSSANRFSLRANIQRLLIDNEHVSFTLGPEISYNYFRGNDEVDERVGQNSERYLYTQKTGLSKQLGFGLISAIEVKQVIKPQLSFCFTIRPEFTTDGLFPKGGNPVFSGVLGFAEFQLGLKYRIKK